MWQKIDDATLVVQIQLNVDGRGGVVRVDQSQGPVLHLAQAEGSVDRGCGTAGATLGTAENNQPPQPASLWLGDSRRGPGNYLAQRRADVVGLQGAGDEGARAGQQGLAGETHGVCIHQGQDGGIGNARAQVLNQGGWARAAQIVVHQDNLGRQVLGAHNGQLWLRYPEETRVSALSF